MLAVQSQGPLAAHVDLDITENLTGEVEAALRELYDRHHMLVFRDQSLSAEAQMSFMSLFGPVVRSGIDGGGIVTNEPDEGNILGSGPLAFHSDLAFSPEPILGISLYAEQVENDRSSTFFVDSIQAYARLPSALKAKLTGMHALHVYGVNLSGPNAEELSAGLPRHVHPLVMPHPRTGEPILFMNYNHTARIVELEKEESDALLVELFEAIYLEEKIYEHRWRNGDIVLWDNLALQHARPNVADVGIRRLRRVVNARVGFFDLYPEFGKPSEPASQDSSQIPRSNK